MTHKEFVEQAVAGRKVSHVSGGRISSTVNKVHTLRGVQHHRGYTGFVYVKFEGERRPETYTCCFHQKARAARLHAEQMSRAFKRMMEDRS